MIKFRDYATQENIVQILAPVPKRMETFFATAGLMLLGQGVRLSCVRSNARMEVPWILSCVDVPVMVISQGQHVMFLLTNTIICPVHLRMQDIV